MLPPSVALEGSLPPQFLDGPVFNTGAADCMRQHLNDALDFLSDFHTLGKIKVTYIFFKIGLISEGVSKRILRAFCSE